MEIPSENPTNSFECELKAHTTKPMVNHHHLHRRKSLKTIQRASRLKYAEIGFTITKLNKKYVAHCKICNRMLGNTAYARLQGHRNVCRGEAPGNEPECSLYPTNDTFVTPSNDDPLLNNSCASQISNDSSGITFNPIQPKLEAMECQLSPEILPYPNNQQDNELLNEENQLKLNIIEVLLLIKYNKKLLFDNENQRSIEMWTKILKKAQSLDLAPSNVSWSYARDSLYAAWRLHTIQKKDAIEAGDVSTKYNIVDLSILQIENDPIETDSTMFEINETTTSVKKKSPSVVKTNSSSTQTTDEMYQADLRMKLLQCEALEIENYKRRLDVFELERKLQILPSKFTDKFVQPAQSSEKSSNGHLRDGEQKNVPKIELDA